MELAYRRGRKFLHRLYRNARNEPSVCTITRLLKGVEHDVVYYRIENGPTLYVTTNRFYSVLLEWVREDAR